MEWPILAVLLAILSLPAKTDLAAVKIECPPKFADDEVCVLRDHSQLTAINPTAHWMTLVLRLERIENVELKYRHPFIEQLPPYSSTPLLRYRVLHADRPVFLDYTWGFTPTR